MKAWIWNFRDAVLWESSGGSGGGGGDRSPDVTNFGPTANGGWSVTNSAGVTTTTDARGMQTTSRSGAAPAQSPGGGSAPAAPAVPATVTTTTTAPVTTAPARTPQVQATGSIAAPQARGVASGSASLGQIGVSGVGQVGSGLSGRSIGTAGIGAALGAAGTARGAAGASSQSTGTAAARSPSAQRALDPAPTTRTALTKSNASRFGVNRAVQVEGRSTSNQPVSFAAPSRRSAERDSMAALESYGTSNQSRIDAAFGSASPTIQQQVQGVRDAVAREAGRQAANPRSSSPSYTYPSAPTGYQPSGIDPLAGGGRSATAGIGAAMTATGSTPRSTAFASGSASATRDTSPRMSGATTAIQRNARPERAPVDPVIKSGLAAWGTSFERVPAQRLSQGVMSNEELRNWSRSRSPMAGPAREQLAAREAVAQYGNERAKAARSTEGNFDLSIGQNRTFSDITNTAPVGSFQPRAGLGSSLGPNYARGMTADAVAGPMSGTRTTLNAPAFGARRSAMNMDTPVRSTASVVMSGPPVASNYTSPERMAAFTQPQPFRSAVRDSLPFAQKDQIPSTTERSRLEDRAQQTAQPTDMQTFRAADRLSMQSLAMETYLDAMITVESANNPKAKAKTSSAAGLAQFTAGTWMNTISKHAPELTKGLTRQQVLDLRYDPVIARDMARALTVENQAYLSRKGVTVTPASTYLAHFAGPNSAARIAKASETNPNAPVSDYVSRAAINANKSILGGKTVSQVMAWAESKMTKGLATAPSGKSFTATTVLDPLGQTAGTYAAPGMARAPAPTPAAQRGLTEEQERSAAAYEQQMLKDLPAGSVYSAETAPSNPVYGDRFRGFGAGGPLGGLLTGNLFNADGTRSSAGFVGSTGDGEGRGPWGQSGAAGDDPAPTTEPPPPPAVNVVEASRRFVDDYIYPTPPVKWPRRELTYQP